MWVALHAHSKGVTGPEFIRLPRPLAQWPPPPKKQRIASPHHSGIPANLHSREFKLFPQIKIILDYKIFKIMEFRIREVQLYHIRPQE